MLGKPSFNSLPRPRQLRRLELRGGVITFFHDLLLLRPIQACRAQIQPKTGLGMAPLHALAFTVKPSE